MEDNKVIVDTVIDLSALMLPTSSLKVILEKLVFVDFKRKSQKFVEKQYQNY